jgi:hypothetical protein
VRLGAAHADEARAALLAQGGLGLDSVVRERPLLEPEEPVLPVAGRIGPPLIR